MIDVNKVEENFNNYVRKFEQTNPKIIIKKFHSIRVKEKGFKYYQIGKKTY